MKPGDLTPNSLVVLAGQLLDGTGGPPRANVAIHIEQARIVGCVPAADLGESPSGRVIDLSDLWVLPGLIDAHVHLWGLSPDDREPPDFETRLARARRQANHLLRAGITTVRDLGSPVAPALRDAVAAGRASGPRILAAYAGLTGAAGPWLVPQPAWWEARVVRGPAEAADGVRRLRDDGAEVIKIGVSTGPGEQAWGDTPTLSTAEIRAICDTAHGFGLRVAAHAIGPVAVRRAVDGGVDTVEHGYGLDAETLESVGERGTWLIPTLRTRHDRPGPEARATICEQLRSLKAGVNAGVRYAAGTDSVGDRFTPHGPGNLVEIELLARELGPDAAILAGTRDAALAIGRSDEIGTLEPGKDADLIAVSADPRRDLAVLGRVDFVMRRGRMIDLDANVCAGPG